MESPNQASSPRNSTMVCNWLVNTLFGLLKAGNINIKKSPVCPDRFGEVIDLVFV